MLQKLLGKAAFEVPSLAAAMAGVGAAWLWFNLGWWVPFVLFGVGTITGVVAELVCRRLLPDNPVAATLIMEGSFLLPGAWAAFFGGLLVVVAVEAEPQKQWDVETKKLAAAGTAAVSGALTALIASALNDNWVGVRVQAAFFRYYQRKRAGVELSSRVRYFPAGSEAERWVHSADFKGVSGWGRSARMARARAIRDILKQSSDPQET